MLEEPAPEDRLVELLRFELEAPEDLRQKPRASAGGYSVAAYPQSFGGDQLAFAPVRPALGEAGRARPTLLRTDWSRS